MEATMASKKQEQSLAGQHSLRNGSAGVPRVPSVAASPTGAASTATTAEPGDAVDGAARETVPSERAEAVVVRVPMVPLPTPCNVVRAFHVRCNRAQAEKLRALRDALWDQDARLVDGKPINSAARAVQWLLEQVKPIE